MDGDVYDTCANCCMDDSGCADPQCTPCDYNFYSTGQCRQPGATDQGSFVNHNESWTIAPCSRAACASKCSAYADCTAANFNRKLCHCSLTKGPVTRTGVYTDGYMADNVCFVRHNHGIFAATAVHALPIRLAFLLCEGVLNSIYRTSTPPCSQLCNAHYALGANFSHSALCRL